MSAEAARQPAAGPIVDVRGVRKIYHRDAAEITVLDGCLAPIRQVEFLRWACEGR